LLWVKFSYFSLDQLKKDNSIYCVTAEPQVTCSLILNLSGSPLGQKTAFFERMKGVNNYLPNQTYFPVSGVQLRRAKLFLSLFKNKVSQYLVHECSK
jgi:hypothetical protein